MADRSKIEWTEATWNPIRARNVRTGKVGWHCEHVTPGCEHCYAEGINKRLGTGLPFKPGHLSNGDVELFLDEKMLLAPLRWKRPRKIFVGSMTDLFGGFVSLDMIARIFVVIEKCPQHTFQILTKRAERMQAVISTFCLDAYQRPLPNVWLGVSAERQEEADERIPHLIETPAAVKFISCEPLLGPIEFKKVPGFNRVNLSLWNWWVIAGGESGSHARPMHPDWARSLRDQCQAAGVAFFMKQWGEWGPDDGAPDDGRDRIFEGMARCAWWDGATWRFEENGYAVDLEQAKGRREWIYRLGKRAAGRLLDGRTHDEFPEARR